MAEALQRYIDTYADRQGIVTIAAGTVSARKSPGNHSDVTLAEIEEYISDRKDEGEISIINRGIQTITLKKKAYSTSHISTRPKHRSHALPTPATMMRAVLAAIAAGANKHREIRSRVVVDLGYRYMTAEKDRALDSHLSSCLEHHRALGNIHRVDKLILLSEQGKDRLQRTTPFEGKEIPRRLRKHTTIPSVPRQQNLDISRILNTVSTLSLGEFVILWRNALTKLVDTTISSERSKIMEVIQAVEKEWGSFSAGGDRFVWPTTDVGASSGGSEVPDIRPDGMLSFLDYRVGKTADNLAAVRQSILVRVFEGNLPQVFDPGYMREWGNPNSVQRLRKIADSIAAFTRNAKRRDEDSLEQAIKDWEEDLDFLYFRYYVGKFGFGWPATSVS